MIEHHIQIAVVSRLVRSEGLRFRDLKPEGMENGAFTYHLNQLVRAGYIEKREDVYQLTPSGNVYTATLSETTNKPRQQPKLIVSIVIENDSGHILFARSKKQPQRGILTLPSGKQHFGETPAEHIKREIIEQFGFDLPVKRRGFIDILVSRQNKHLSHIAGHVYYAKVNIDTPQESPKFTYEWLNISMIDARDTMPGVLPLIMQLHQTDDDVFVSLDETIF